MSTTTLVTTLVDDYFKTYSRTKILSYINRVQNWCFNHDCFQTLFLNHSDDTFPLPFLSTTAGTLSYVIDNSTLLDSDGNTITVAKAGYPVLCRRVKRISIEVSNLLNFDYNTRYYGQRFTWSGVNYYWSKRLGETEFQEIPIYQFDKSDAESCRVTFAEDPGTHTNRYYIEFYFTPPQLSSEAIPMVMDSNMWFELIVEGVTAIVRDVENGDVDRRKWKAFAEYWRQPWLDAMNRGADQHRPQQIIYRGAG